MYSTALNPPAPEHAIEISLRETPTSPPCQLLIDPPEGSGWMLTPGLRGPRKADLKFWRAAGRGLFSVNTRQIEVVSVSDTLLYSPASPDAAWLHTLLGDRFPSEGVRDVREEVESTHLTRRAGVECLAVQFRSSCRSTVNGVGFYERGVAYVRRFPCESWHGLLVFLMSESTMEELTGEWSPPDELGEALDQMMGSVRRR